MPEQRELCLLPVPFSDLSSTKRRPVIIISNNSYNNSSKDVLVIAVTSNLSGKSCTIDIDSIDMESGSLKTPSKIRFDKIYSIDHTLIIRSFGKITLQKFEEIVKNLNGILKINN
jgi:mRNA interferase MazF